MLKTLNEEKIFSFNHKGVEILSINISGFKKNDSNLNPILEKEVNLLRKPYTCKNVAFHIYDTVITDETARQICLWFVKLKDNLFRIAVIGLNLGGTKLIKKYKKKQDCT
jgi:hypothetical protein